MDGGKSALRLIQTCRAWEAYVSACEKAGGRTGAGNCTMISAMLAQSTLKLLTMIGALRKYLIRSDHDQHN